MSLLGGCPRRGLHPPGQSQRGWEWDEVSPPAQCSIPTPDIPTCNHPSTMAQLRFPSTQHHGHTMQGPMGTHHQLLLVGHLVRQGPDPLISTVHTQARAEPRQLLVAPRMVPAAGEEGMGTQSWSRLDQGRPDPQPASAALTSGDGW